MKVVIAGSRDFVNEFVGFAIIESFPYEINEIVCGCAQGMDTIGLHYGNFKGIPVTLFPADWKTFGRAAGPIRNEKMAIYADSAIIAINNMSKGSLNMLEHMKRLKKPYLVAYFNDGTLDRTEFSPDGIRTEGFALGSPRPPSSEDEPGQIRF